MHRERGLHAVKDQSFMCVTSKQMGTLETVTEWQGMYGAGKRLRAVWHTDAATPTPTAPLRLSVRYTIASTLLTRRQRIPLVSQPRQIEAVD